MRPLITSRTRSEDLPGVSMDLDCSYIVEYGIPPSWTVLDATQYLRFPGSYYPFSRETKDCLTENWEIRSRRGDIVMNDYEHFERTESSVKGTIGWNSGHASYSGSVDWPYKTRRFQGHVRNITVSPDYNWVPSSLYAWNIDTLAAQATTAAYANRSEAEMLSMVTVAEIYKTARTVKRVYGLVLYLFQKGARIRKLLSRGVITAAQATDSWLEIRYGLRPLFYEIQDAFAAIGSVNKPYRHRITGTSSDEYHDEFQGPSPNATTLPGVAVLAKTFDAECIVQTGLLVESRLVNVPVTAILGHQEFNQTVWELIPFSFIVDWFLNTGKFFAAWQPRIGTEILGSWTSVKHTYASEVAVIGFIPSETVPHTTPEVTGLRDRVSESYSARYANPQRPILPSVNIRLDGLKLLDILALLENVNPSKWRI